MRTRVVAAVAAALLVCAGAARGGAAPTGASRRATLAFAGDILFDRGVRDAIERNGVASLFASVAPTLAAADLAVANLECPLSTRGLRAAKPFSFRGDPSWAASLAAAGIDAVTLANNHSLDYGRTALLDTVAALEGAGVAAVGAGTSRAEALRPRLFECNGLRIALLGYCDLFIEGTTPRADAPGVASGDVDALVDAAHAARASADVVVVFMHWGVEYRPTPTDAQRELARRLTDAGAALVVGAHPHVLQPIERAGPRLVAYSLGNFVFDQQRQDGSDSAILLVTVTAAGVESFTALPVRIDACRPAIAAGADAERIARRLAPP